MTSPSGHDLTVPIAVRILLSFHCCFMSFTFIRPAFHTKEQFRYLLHVYILKPTKSVMTLFASCIFPVN
jgi:hypothetical protein